MRLSESEFAEVLKILVAIDERRIRPRIPGRIGQFLRQYEAGRADVERLLSDNAMDSRADGAISGRSLDVIEAYPLRDPEVSLLRSPLGEVAEAIAVSEQLGGPTDLVMWLKAPAATAAYNLLRERSGLRLSGDWRWTPPNRLTTGEALVEQGPAAISWRDSRCLKAVADDLDRPPHALEYILDYRLGPPGLKYFRCVYVSRNRDIWYVIPGLSHPIRLNAIYAPPEVTVELRSAQYAALLIYREPWEQRWTIVEAVSVTDREVVEHAMTWVDFQRELAGAELTGALIRGVKESMRAIGLRPSSDVEPNLSRNLLPVASGILRWFRGTS